MRKTSISLILIVIIGLFSAPFNAQAAENSYSIENTDNDISDYLQTDKGKKEFWNTVERSFLNEPCIYNGIDGDIEVSQPFGIPLYNTPTESIFNMEYERYSLCYCSGRAVGIMGFIPDGSDFLMIYYMLPDGFSFSDSSLCFYDDLYSSNGDIMYGSGIRRTIIAADSSNAGIVYLDKSNSQIRNDYRFKALTDSKYFQSEYKNLKKFNCLNEKLPIICTLKTDGYSRTLPETFSCKIINSSNGKALTYSDGKYTVDDISADNSDSQIFEIRRNGNGYSIFPKANTKKKMCIDNNSEVNIHFSYHSEIVCNLSEVNGNVLKLKNEKPVCGKYDFWDTSCDWILTEVS